MAASHVTEPEGPTTRLYNYVLGGFEEKKKKKEDWQQTLAQGQSLKKKIFFNQQNVLSIVEDVEKLEQLCIVGG